MGAGDPLWTAMMVRPFTASLLAVTNCWRPGSSITLAGSGPGTASMTPRCPGAWLKRIGPLSDCSTRGCQTGRGQGCSNKEIVRGGLKKVMMFPSWENVGPQWIMGTRRRQAAASRNTGGLGTTSAGQCESGNEYEFVVLVLFRCDTEYCNTSEALVSSAVLIFFSLLLINKCNNIH